MKKILSIIIPTYNMEKYLQKCLDSLILDDYEMFKTLDILIVNDGSKDNSLSIAKGYEQKYPGIYRVIDKENGNYGSCINAALPNAAGKYIKVLDADDSFNKENLSLMLSALRVIDVDMFITDFEIVNDKGKTTSVRRANFPKNIMFNMPDFIPTQTVFSMHAVTYKTQNLRNIGYHQTEKASYTDVEWVFAPITTIKTAYYYPIIIYKYLIGRAGQTVEGNTVHKRTNERFRILQDCMELYDTLVATNIHPNTLRYIENHLAFQIRGLYVSLLLVNKDKNSAYELDKYLKSRSLKFFQQSESYIINQYIPNKFIRYWRKRGDLPTVIAFAIYNKVKYIFSRIR